jgi:Fe-S oxidoreductase
MLKRAKRQLTDILAALRPALRSGIPIVVLEPSCLTVFKDELTNLLPEDEDAQRLRNQSFQVAEFLDRSGYRPRPVSRPAIVHGHCHQKAVLGMKAPMKLLDAAGVKAELLDSGCCGMAGSFGFESDHFDISMKVGERTLLPKVRSTGHDAIVITDGFSCREQIAQTTGRRALHTVEVLAMALPRTEPMPNQGANATRKVMNAAIAAGILAGIGLLAYRLFR